MNTNQIGLAFLFSLLLSSCTENNSLGRETGLNIKDSRSADQWYSQGKERVQNRQAALIHNIQTTRELNKPKNIIFVLGDGMGVSTLTAARIFVGQHDGKLGEEGALSFEHFPYSALVKTYNVDLQTPDSAGTMSALMTGVKTDEGIISLPDSVIRADCTSSVEKPLPTFIDLAKLKGKSTAMVTTARVTHATPATTYAHSVDRDWESDHAIPAIQKNQGCIDIASQFVDNQNHSLDILMGGGRRHFLPKAEGGKRTDGKNLIAEWQSKGHYVSSLEQLKELQQTYNKDDLSVSELKPWLGLFSSSHMDYTYQRPAEQPSLQQMAAAALQRLEENDQGYALVIEAGRIDHGHHDGVAYKALTETQELHETVAWLLTQVDLQETLIIVTADHSHTLTLAGYATRGNPILGEVVGNDKKGYPKSKASLSLNGESYTSLGYRDGPGANYSEHELQSGNRDTHSHNYRQSALVPMDYETHGGEDVALYAIGPQAQLFTGTLEQHWIFHALKYAL